MTELETRNAFPSLRLLIRFAPAEGSVASRENESCWWPLSAMLFVALSREHHAGRQADPGPAIAPLGPPHYGCARGP